MSQLPGNLDLLLLAVLRDSPAHGYAVIAALRECSGGTFDLAEGSVYPALHRLESDGLVTSRAVVAEGRRRRVYALNAAGSRALVQRTTSWREFSAAVDLILPAAAR